MATSPHFTFAFRGSLRPYSQMQRADRPLWPEQQQLCVEFILQCRFAEPPLQSHSAVLILE